ncbi:MAG: DegT/DnrJ/EryC1/StrS aminotransferase family protein [Lentisphaeraceae bacterium]|nr:DegT/DnrJ/EryC1/StrS aminotransferase family protein [Lentisphaeraceae bacterium]
MIPHSKPYLTESDFKAVENCLSTGMIASGAKNSSLANHLNDFIGTKGTICCNTGTSALLIALAALDVSDGDEVIIPSYACESLHKAILSLGASAVLSDSGEHWVITSAQVAHKITPNTKCIIIVHTFGVFADIESFKKFNLSIIEDCAQAFGAGSQDNKAGSLGDFATFSFNATKCLTSAEGGAVAASTEKNWLKLQKAYKKYKPFLKLSDLQATLVLNQLEHYNSFLEKRQKVANEYIKHIDKLTNIKAIKRPEKSIYFRFTCHINEMNEKVTKFFAQQNVAVRRGVDQLLHRKLNLPDEDFPNATTNFTKTLSLPIYPGLEDKELNKVIEALKNYNESFQS